MGVVFELRAAAEAYIAFIFYYIRERERERERREERGKKTYIGWMPA